MHANEFIFCQFSFNCILYINSLDFKLLLFFIEGVYNPELIFFIEYNVDWKTTQTKLGGPITCEVSALKQTNNQTNKTAYEWCNFNIC